MFGELLKQERERAGFSQYHLAKLTGLTSQALSLLELGEREPSWGTVQRLALALGVDYGTFADADLTLPADVPAPRPKGRPRKQTAQAEEKPQRPPSRSRQKR